MSHDQTTPDRERPHEAAPAAVDPVIIEQLLAPGGPLVGRRIGNFVVDVKLGQGGMGAVFRLRHQTLPRTYAAMKVLSTSSESLRARFEQEALIAALIGSHRVVKPLDVGTLDEGLPYILMEYVEGRSLDEVIQRAGMMDIRRAVRIVLRVADTMVAAHDEGIVHRDLKPSNIMLVDEGARADAVRVLDWGVARMSGQHKRAFTQAQVVLGSPGYWAPEASMGQPSDGRADVFSLGVIAYRMLTAARPYPRGEGPDFLLVMKAPPPAALNEVRARAGIELAPPELESIVAAMLQRDRNLRPWMHEVRARLASLLARLEDSDAPRTVMSVARQRSPGSPEPAPAAGDEIIRRVIDSLGTSGNPLAGKEAAERDAPTRTGSIEAPRGGAIERRADEEPSPASSTPREIPRPARVRLEPPAPAGSARRQITIGVVLAMVVLVASVALGLLIGR